MQVTLGATYPQPKEIEKKNRRKAKKAEETDEEPEKKGKKPQLECECGYKA
jgi:hypothetical protein